MNLRGDFFRCLQHDLQNATSKRYLKIQASSTTSKRYLKTLPQNANSNGGDASRVGIAKGKAYKLY